MDSRKKTKLENSGWRVVGTSDFLELSPEEAALIELKLVLSDELRNRRVKAGVTQGQLARRIGSSQSRVAKMEGADSSVTLDLMIRAYFALGATPRELARAIGRAKAA